MEKLYAPYRRWAPISEMQEDGIVVASDEALEWMLPWWWDRYRCFNSYPVTFVDFGLSAKMKQWCKKRGHYIFLPVADVFVAEKKEVDPVLSQRWEDSWGDKLWLNRPAWFKKPLACLQSPYRRSIWLDLDCEVCGSLSPLFSLCESGEGMAIFKEGFHPLHQRVTYNSGVIVFKRGISLIEKWADVVFESNQEFLGDQDALSHLICDQQLIIMELPAVYNWSRDEEKSPDVVILHWHGGLGKCYIYYQLFCARLKELYP